MKEDKRDLVEVVRCGDCRYFIPAVFDGYEPVEPPYCDKIGCEFFDPPFYFGDEPRDDPYDANSPYDYMDNGFCAWGERKLSRKKIRNIINDAPPDILELIELGVMSEKDVAYAMARASK